MKYVFTSLNNRDSGFFKYLISEHKYRPITLIDFETSAKDLHMNHPIDYDFILEYYLKRFEPITVYSTILAQVNKLYDSTADYINEDDIVISANSGEWTSRLLHQIAELKRAKFLYFEGFYLSNYYQLSSKPFTTSKYGVPEFLEKHSQNTNFTEEDREFLTKYLSNKQSKYPQSELKERLENSYDYFIVGQVYYDTNVVLLNKKLIRTSDDLCCYIALNNKDKTILYKPHPNETQLNKVLKDLSNITITKNSLYEIFPKVKEIHTISSTVGLEAGFQNLPVTWHSDTHMSQFDLSSEEKQFCFINSCLAYAFKDLRENFVIKINELTKT